ncbi:MAG: PQQ-binding-like beta-propeller repeat protein [Verrucomicrobiae bacterium]|nr:PQQ-binding-like beta-propeller repeat protein [Verrucomicrobiae bacterium]
MKLFPSAFASALRRTGVVFAVLAVSLAILLGVDYSRSRAFAHPGQKIDKMRADLAQRPQDEDFKKQIRRQDVEERRQFFGFQEKCHLEGHGALLFGLLAVLSWRIAALLPERRSQRAPQIKSEESFLAPLAVLAVGCGLLAGLGWLGINSRPDVLLASMGGGEKDAPGKGDATFPTEQEWQANWPVFRGPRGIGVAAGAQPPAAWDVPANVNVLWKTPVPLAGENSPVVWGNRVFLSGASGEKREVFAFDADSGKLLWRREVGEARPPVKDASSDVTGAAATMAVDGRRVYAIFATGDLAALDFEGKVVWSKSLGKPDVMYGFASSLAMFRNLLILQRDQGSSAEDGKSVLMALESATGRQVWSVKRPVPNSWSTPVAIDTPECAEIVTCGKPWVMGYDPLTGQEKWRAECLDGEVAPSPVWGCGMVFVANEGAKAAGIRLGGKGDVTKTHIAWSFDEGLPDIISPVTDGKLLFLTTSQGQVTCLNAADGVKLWQQELNESARSSPVIAGNRVWLATTKGNMHVFAAAPQFKPQGKISIGEPVDASPAFVGKRIYIRGRNNLVCVGEK